MRSLVTILFTACFLIAPYSAASAQDEPLQLVASFSILADVAQNVAGNRAEVSSLVPVGADPHSFEPSARDIAALEGADLIIIAGANFEETLLETIRSAAPDVKIVEASTCVPMRSYTTDDHEDEPYEEVAGDHQHVDALGLDLDTLCTGYATYISDIDTLKSDMGFASARMNDIPTSGWLFESECAGGDDHSDEASGDEEHDRSLCDPHVWSDPRSAYYWTLYIRDVLSAADPGNAESYYGNAEEYLYAIDDLLRLNLEPLLADIPDERRVLMTNHDTLSYFAAAYGFETLGFVLPGGSAIAEPSAQDLGALIDMVRTQNVAAIFTESTISSRVAEQVAAETNAMVYTLYSDSLSDAGGPASTYLDYITYNFTTIAAALAAQ